MKGERRRLEKSATDHDRNVDAPAVEAILFDMDGVVTKTAVAHAAAWKRLFDEFLKARADTRGETFQPFDIDRDYREYVDGKPRVDGVRSFLASRGIALPEGNADDGPDEESVWALGNRKNRYFHRWLAENRVETFPGTLAFLNALESRSIKVAVFSASRNAEAVLENAGVRDRFLAKVDGNDMAELRLPGKPDPAILIEAASRLDTAPRRAVVVEDAIAGVEAGARGGFGVVVGVDRAGQAANLARAGASLVVNDLAELDVDERCRLRVKTIDRLPSAWEFRAAIRARIVGKRLAVFLDYDGTLTPIVDDPEKADLDESTRTAVARLARAVTVAIVSGRDLKDVRERVGLDFVFMAGSHGFEIAGPKGWHETLEKGTAFLSDLDRAEAALRDRLGGIDGAVVERKRYSIAVHYRRVRNEDKEQVKTGVDDIVAGYPRLRLGFGKMVFQLQPRIDWDKGKALNWILAQLDLDRPDVLPLYIGDDVTDETAFRVLSNGGIGIVVRDGDRNTAADYALANPAEVRRFLEQLAADAGGDGP